MSIIGHERQLKFLGQALASGRAAHAYLFAGPEGIGKKLVALHFAKLLLCFERLAHAPAACNSCATCVQVDAGTHPDVVLEAADPRTSGVISRPSFPIERIRALRERMALAPMMGERKVAILDGVEYLTPEAANALLKTLEEPKGNATIVLLAAAQDRVLPTIVSRAQRIAFLPVADSELREGLLEQGFPKKAAEEAVQYACGIPGRAFRFLAEPDARMREQKEAERFARAMQEQDAQCWSCVEELSALRHDALLDRIDATVGCMRSDMLSGSTAKGSRTHAALKALLEARRMILTTNIQPRWILEMAFLTLLRKEIPSFKYQVPN